MSPLTNHHESETAAKTRWFEPVADFFNLSLVEKRRGNSTGSEPKHLIADSI
jgi:hypothetical protein